MAPFPQAEILSSLTGLQRSYPHCLGYCAFIYATALLFQEKKISLESSTAFCAHSLSAFSSTMIPESMI